MASPRILPSARTTTRFRDAERKSFSRTADRPLGISQTDHRRRQRLVLRRRLLAGAHLPSDLSPPTTPSSASRRCATRPAPILSGCCWPASKTPYAIRSPAITSTPRKRCASVWSTTLCQRRIARQMFQIRRARRPGAAGDREDQPAYRQHGPGDDGPAQSLAVERRTLGDGAPQQGRRIQQELGRRQAKGRLDGLLRSRDAPFQPEPFGPNARKK